MHKTRIHGVAFHSIIAVLVLIIFSFLPEQRLSGKAAVGYLNMGLVDDTNTSKKSFHDGPLTQEVDSILVVKRFRHMYVFNNKKLLKVYHVALGDSPIGHKHFQGDLKTPEGLYFITDKNPYSVAHESLGISYPNDNDRKYARKFGKPTGGDVKIHGLMNGDTDDDIYAKEDWTWGCIALKNKEIDELFNHIKIGAPIFILP